MIQEQPQFLHGDCIEVLERLPSESVDLVLTDIPYGISLDEWDVLHNNTNSALGGQSPAQKKLGSGFKRRGKPINGWSKADLNRPKEYQQWCITWARPVLATMKPGASAFIFCGRRTLHRAIVALEDAGFLLRDLLCWAKPSAHFRAQSLSKLFERRGMEQAASEWGGWRLGNLAPMFEPIVWCFKPYTLGGTIADNVLAHGVGAMNVDACLQNDKSPGNILQFDFEPNERGHHEAQKPIALLEYLVRLTTRESQTVLDPFCGSGSTGVAAVNLHRHFIGIDQDAEHIAVTKRRIDAALNGRRLHSSTKPRPSTTRLLFD